jgi:hypothetical protein
LSSSLSSALRFAVINLCKLGLLFQLLFVLAEGHEGVDRAREVELRFFLPLCHFLCVGTIVAPIWRWWAKTADSGRHSQVCPSEEVTIEEGAATLQHMREQWTCGTLYDNCF